MLNNEGYRHTQNMYYLLIFHGKYGTAQTPHSYVYMYTACLVF